MKATSKKDLDAQLSISYDYIVNIFTAQHPRVPSPCECFGDGSVHAYNKVLFANVYSAIKATLSEKEINY